MLANISPSELALELLNHCLRGGTWPADLLEALIGAALSPDPGRAREGSRALFGILVERLADLFEPDLASLYAAMFSSVVAAALPELNEAGLVARYHRVRAVRPFSGDTSAVRDVFVLSRVTLGADVAIASVMLDAAKRRFPGATVWFAGPHKNWELFNADPRLKHLPMSYGRRGNPRDRLRIFTDLRDALSRPASIVLDPDSRLTQLGLLPVCPEENYWFFESRAYGSATSAPLPVLAALWLAETFGVADARPYIAPRERPDAGHTPLITVSFGVGENPSKRMRDPFEENLLRGLARAGSLVLVDQGAGGEEATRVERAIHRSGAGPGQIRTWDGAFAPFASLIQRSRLYVGYDSAGQHVAAACGVPLVTIFAGFAGQRMFDRWKPSGSGPMHVLRVDDPDPDKVLVDALSAAYRL